MQYPRQHKLADAAIKIQDTVTGAAVIFLFMLALGWLALHGDDIQQTRLQTEQLGRVSERHSEPGCLETHLSARPELVCKAPTVSLIAW